MNVSDSELMLGLLAREGFARVDAPSEADVLLVNTCAVRDHAEQRVLSRMGELKAFKRPGGVLGVVGCMAQRLGHDSSSGCRRWIWWWAPTVTGTCRS